MAKAISAPGIDPRCWNCVGYVEEFGVDEEGPFVNVTVMPSEELVPCRVGSLYAGPNFGFFAPLEKDDEVIVFAPNGDPNEGLIAFGRQWSKSDPPPQEVLDDKGTNVHLVIKEGVNLNISVSGGGKVTFGAPDAQENFVLGQQWKAMMEAFFDAINALTVPTGVGPSGTPINAASFTQLKSNLEAQLSDIIFGKKTT
jgi:hypothetical protein